MLKHTKDCAKTAKLDYSKLSACVNDPTQSAALQKAFSKLTPSDHQWVPWVVVDGKLLNDEDKLLKQVCKVYKGKKPKACKKALAEDDEDDEDEGEDDEGEDDEGEDEGEEAKDKRCPADW